MFRGRSGDRSFVPNILVVITDGTPTVSPHRAAHEARRLREAGVTIVAVGVGEDGDVAVRQFDTQSTTTTAAQSFFVPSYNNLQTIRRNLNKHICDGRVV